MTRNLSFLSQKRPLRTCKQFWQYEAVGGATQRQREWLYRLYVCHGRGRCASEHDLTVSAENDLTVYVDVGSLPYAELNSISCSKAVDAAVQQPECECRCSCGESFDISAP